MRRRTWFSTMLSEAEASSECMPMAWATLRAMPLTIQVEAHEADRRARFAQFYLRRGASLAEADALYQGREVDEHRHIREVGSQANHRVTLDDIFSPPRPRELES